MEHFNCRCFWRTNEGKRECPIGFFCLYGFLCSRLAKFIYVKLQKVHTRATFIDAIPYFFIVEGMNHYPLINAANLGSHMEGSLTLNFFPKIVQLATSFVFHFRVSFSDALQVAVLGLHMREKSQKGVGGVGEEEGFVTVSH